MQRVPQLVVVAVLVMVSTLGFRGSFDGWTFVLPAATGTSISFVALLLAKRHRLYVGESVALSTVLFAFAGAIVSRGSYPDFFAGLIGGWADLLSSAPPTLLTPELAVLPYVIGWMAMMIGGELSRRATHPILPIVGPLTSMAATALVSVESPGLVAVQGLTLTIGAILLGLLHLWLVVEPLTGEDSAGSVSRRASALGLTAMIAVTAPVIGPGLPLAGANERFDLRDHRERPWDPLAEPSPLVTLKASLKEGRSEAPVFRVTSEVLLTRWTTAVLASYNGTVWAVADEGPGAPAAFEPVDLRFPDTDDDPVAGEAGVTYRIELAEPTLWIPVAGRAVAVEGASELRFNRATGTIADPFLAAAGSTFELTSVPRAERSAVDLITAGNPVVADETGLELVPPQLRNLAGDLFEGVDPGPARVVTLANRFTQAGFYDHDETIRPGHNLSRLGEFLGDPEQIVGYAEQYAAAAAVLSQLGGVPSRVVVGYQIPPDRYIDGVAEVVADDVSAWIEIRTAAFGWVPIDVTPDRAREPQEESQGVTITDVAIPNPPPPPPPPPGDQVMARPEVEDDELDEADERTRTTFGTAIPTPVVVATTAVGVPTILLGALALAVVVAKHRRTVRRRRGTTRQQVVGAWQELLDGYAEAGVVTSPAATPDEVVASLVHADASAAAAVEDLRALADHVDRAAFHPLLPDDTTADDAWRRSAAAIATLRQSRSRPRRLAMRTDPRPLIRRTTSRR